MGGSRERQWGFISLFLSIVFFLFSLLFARSFFPSFLLRLSFALLSPSLLFLFSLLLSLLSLFSLFIFCFSFLSHFSFLFSFSFSPSSLLLYFFFSSVSFPERSEGASTPFVAGLRLISRVSDFAVQVKLLALLDLLAPAPLGNCHRRAAPEF